MDDILDHRPALRVGALTDIEERVKVLLVRI
jgi:hypothetical protein